MERGFLMNTAIQSGTIGEKVDTLVCFNCAEPLDVSSAPPFSVVACPYCETKQTVPRTLGPFLLIKFLGKGGMGEVYRGYDPLLKRHVAIKVLGGIIENNPDAVENFMREARTAAQINSPYVVSVYSVGEVNNQPYIVMELINGGQLDKLIAHHPISEEQALEIIRDAACGLLAAQEIGLFHGDIKPENILFDHHGTAKIADFGLAQFLAKGSKSKSGEIWGTPYYIAPEKVKHKQEDYRSDIYSLGATFFHILTGEPPFEGETAVDVVLARLQQLPPDIRNLNPDIHETTASIVNRMLEPDPNMRYPNYASLIADIDKASTAIKNRPTTNLPSKSKGLFFILLALLLIATGIGGWLFLRHNNRIFTENQNKSLSVVVTKWGRSRYGFDPSALDAVKADITRIGQGLPPDSPAAVWIDLLRGTIDYLRHATNEYTATFHAVVHADTSGMEVDELQSIDAARGLAAFMLSTNTATSMTTPSQTRPAWISDLATYYTGLKYGVQGQVEQAVYFLERYARKMKQEDAPTWPYAFQYSAQNFADNMRKWQNRGELIAKLAASGQTEKAREKMMAYQAEVIPLFAGYLNAERVKNEEPAPLISTDKLPGITTSKPKASQVKRAKKTAVSLRKQAEKKAQQEDAATLTDFMTVQKPLLVQRKFTSVLASEKQWRDLLKTDQGIDAMEIEMAKVQRLATLQATVRDLVGRTALTRSIIKALGGNPVGADAEGIYIDSGAGRRLLRWDELDNARYIKLAGTLIAKSKMGSSRNCVLELFSGF
ncbi:MAG: serine/threonine protein kinase [Spartobacteria bacterium]|nr:serine/threonine protein kinase [Spartobacteria bacterium]